MKIIKQDLINKIETFIGEINYLSKEKLNKLYYQELCDEASEWVEEIRNNEIDFVQ